MENMTWIPRGLWFFNGVCEGTMAHSEGASLSVVFLPTDHYDFLGPIQVYRLTLRQIEENIAEFMMG